MPRRPAVVHILLALVSIGLLAGACGSDSKASSPNPTVQPTAAPAFPVQLERSDGKTVSLDKAPSRFVSLSPGATEIIYALGAEGELAAVDQQADYPQGAKDFPTKLDAFQPNVEAITALHPDLVFVSGNDTGLVDALDRLNIPVLYSELNDVKSLDDVFGQITLLGQATGKNAAASALIASLKTRVQKVEDGVAGVQEDTAPRVYHELDDTYFSVSDQTFIGDLYRVLKANNIAGDGGGIAYPQLTQEAIIAANPTAIVLADEAFGTTVDSVKQRAGWSNIDAVKNNAIFAVDPDIISRAGPRIVDALEQLAKDLYPEKFP